MVERKERMAQTRQEGLGSFLNSEAPNLKNMKLKIKRDGSKLDLKSLKMPT